MVAKSAGEMRIGARGAVAVVLKLRFELALVPPAFFAFTRQKYVVPKASPDIIREVPVRVESLKRVVVKAALVETCKR